MDRDARVFLLACLLDEGDFRDHDKPKGGAHGGAHGGGGSGGASAADGKAHKLPAGYIGEVFPALGEFCAVARRVDPKWAFSSDWFGNLGGSDD